MKYSTDDNAGQDGGGRGAGEHRPGGVQAQSASDQLTYGVVAEERDRQGEQPVDHGGLEGSVRTALEPHQREGARKVEQGYSDLDGHQSQAQRPDLVPEGMGDHLAEHLGRGDGDREASAARWLSP